MNENDDIDLASLNDEELSSQMHDDLYDGLKEEVEEGVNILLERGWEPYSILTDVLVEGMRIVGIDFRDGILFVPEVLLSGHHKKIEEWNNDMRQKKTKKIRPDIWKKYKK